MVRGSGQDDFFRLNEKGNPLPDEKMARLRSLWTPPRFQPVGATRQSQQMQIPSDSSSTTFTPTSVSVRMPVELSLELPGQFTPCTVTAVCSDPKLLAAIAEIRDRGPSYSDPTVSIKSLPPRDWRITSLRTEMEASTMMSGPPASETNSLVPARSHRLGCPCISI